MANISPANIGSLTADLNPAEPIPTGLHDLDDCTTGLRGGQFIVVAGYPGMGASALGLTFARSAAFGHGCGTYVASLESTAADVGRLVMSAEADVARYRMEHQTLSDQDRTKIADRAGAIAAAPLRIVDEHRDLASIREDAFAFGGATGNLRVVFVDGVHLLVPAHDYGGRAQFADDFARDLKELAVLHGIAVIATLPLEFPFAERGDRRPLLRDLGKRQSFAGAADVVILIHREDAYDIESSRAGEADLIVAKNRSGPKVTVTVAFQGHKARFVNMQRIN